MVTSGAPPEVKVRGKLGRHGSEKSDSLTKNADRPQILFRPQLQIERVVQIMAGCSANKNDLDILPKTEVF
jgi:hypothetical protein